MSKKLLVLAAISGVLLLTVAHAQESPSPIDQPVWTEPALAEYQAPQKVEIPPPSTESVPRAPVTETLGRTSRPTTGEMTRVEFKIIEQEAAPVIQPNPVAPPTETETGTVEAATSEPVSTPPPEPVSEIPSLPICGSAPKPYGRDPYMCIVN